MGCHFFLQSIFPTQGSNLGLPHCRQTLYPLSHQGCYFLIYNKVIQLYIYIYTHTHIHILFCVIFYYGLYRTLNLVTCAIKWRRQWHPTPVLLPGKSHGWRSLVGCSPWGRWESNTTEQFHFHFSLFTFMHREGNGNPLPCSCLENPRDGRAWWAAIYGVTQSRTRLKWLSSSSSYKVGSFCVSILYTIVCFC